MKSIFAALVALLLLCYAPVGLAGEGGGQAPAAPADPASEPIFHTVSPREAQEMIAQRKDLLIVDVRGPEERKGGYIAGSVFIPYWEIANGRKKLPTDRPLLLICAVGGRSYALGQYCYQKGYREVYNLQGGIENWKQAGLPLVYQQNGK